MTEPDHLQPTMAAPATPVVLVVEDDDTVRGVVCRTLEHAGLVVREATSGRGALAMLREGVDAAAMVTDLKMAEGSGGWLLAQVAYEFPGLLPRVIVMSGNAGGAAAAHVVARWRCPILAKPFSMAQLIDLVRRVTGDADVSAPPRPR